LKNEGTVTRLQLLAIRRSAFGDIQAVILFFVVAHKHASFPSKKKEKKGEKKSWLKGKNNIIIHVQTTIYII